MILFRDFEDGDGYGDGDGDTSGDDPQSFCSILVSDGDTWGGDPQSFCSILVSSWPWLLYDDVGF